MSMMPNTSVSPAASRTYQAELHSVQCLLEDETQDMPRGGRRRPRPGGGYSSGNFLARGVAVVLEDRSIVCDDALRICDDACR